jgi:DNA modification methylase
MGTGTTAIACERFCDEGSIICIGCELSEKQVEYSKERLEKYRNERKNQIKFDGNE